MTREEQWVVTAGISSALGSSVALPLVGSPLLFFCVSATVTVVVTSSLHLGPQLTPPGFRAASIATLLLGPRFGRLAEDIRADCVTEWTEAEAAGNRRLARWLRVRTGVVIIANAIVYVVKLPLDLALKVKQHFFG